MRLFTFALVIIGASLALAPSAYAAHHEKGGAACVGFGPQTPRDIDNTNGNNARVFTPAPASTAMNLCNIHFHTHAEHKAADYSVYAEPGVHGHGGGYQCNATETLSPAELKAPATVGCKEMKPGDTVEVHWVYTSCDAKPGKGLGSCLSKSCANPELRVEAAVFLVVNDDKATDFTDFAYRGNMANGYHQPKALPTKNGSPVIFLGSTTGPAYTEQSCSPMQVTWSVRPTCDKVSIDSMSAFCKGNVFEEDHAHGVRQLVTNPALLAPMN